MWFDLTRNAPVAHQVDFARSLAKRLRKAGTPLNISNYPITRHQNDGGLRITESAPIQ